MAFFPCSPSRRCCALSLETRAFLLLIYGPIFAGSATVNRLGCQALRITCTRSIEVTNALSAANQFGHAVQRNPHAPATGALASRFLKVTSRRLWLQVLKQSLRHDLGGGSHHRAVLQFVLR